MAALLLGSFGVGCAAGSGPPETTPRLVVVLAVDQLRPDRLSPELPGGFGRLVRGGRVFRDAAIEHAYTETCTGHATLLTGRHPRTNGIPANHFIDAETFERRYCFEDPGPDGVVIGPNGPVGEPSTDGRSPRNLRSETLGDWMKAAWPGARVVSVSAKDRAAIAMGGQAPDAAYWLDGDLGAFVSSRHYTSELPAWARAWRFETVRAGVPDEWVHPARERPQPLREDDHRAESPLKSRTSPHPILRVPEEVTGDEARRLEVAQLGASPWLDDRTLAFTRDLVRNEQLGQGEAPDLLALSLSATDYIGHHYGPFSQESRDALLRLDAQLLGFLELLDEQVGAGRWLLVLTADHGVLALPEWLQERGESRCPVAGGRLEPGPIDSGLDSALLAELGDDGAEAGRWVARLKARYTVNRARVALAGTTVDEVVDAARAHLKRERGIAKVWVASELDADPPQAAGTAELFYNAMSPGRGGDFALETDADCMLTGYRTGTGHGSPHAYDRRVPLVFYGAGIAPGDISGRAAPIDITPTLAGLLGLATPSDLDGQPLPLGRLSGTSSP